MIKIEGIRVYNFEKALHGMRNPLESWDKSDSRWLSGVLEAEDDWYEDYNYGFIIGDNDEQLALKLIQAGSDHRKFLRQIFISMDITAPLYWYKEFDTYKIGTVANSTSTMHKIMSKPFTVDKFSIDEDYQNDAYINILMNHLNDTRYKYLLCKEKGFADKAKEHWRYLIQILPSSWNQTRTWTANYEVLRNIYHARKNHKLNEWQEFCRVIEDLPHSEFITI